MKAQKCKHQSWLKKNVPPGVHCTLGGRLHIQKQKPKARKCLGYLTHFPYWLPAYLPSGLPPESSLHSGLQSSHLTQRVSFPNSFHSHLAQDMGLYRSLWVTWLLYFSSCIIRLCLHLDPVAILLQVPSATGLSPVLTIGTKAKKERGGWLRWSGRKWGTVEREGTFTRGKTPAST